MNALTRIRNVIAGDKGFTLLETLAVMVLVGLLIAITAPQMAEQRKKAALTEVKQNLHDASLVLEMYHAEEEQYPATADVGTTATTRKAWFLAQGLRMRSTVDITGYTSNAPHQNFTIAIRDRKYTNAECNGYQFSRNTGNYVKLC